MGIEQIISIVGAVGISTIISAVLTYVQTNKKNQLDHITKERSKWRKSMKEILVDLNDETGDKRERAISRLKNQINPYGKNIAIKNSRDYFMKEGHIWDLLDKNSELSAKNIDKLSLYVRLLLKYDWNRSKGEIKGKTRWREKIIWGVLLVSSLVAFGLLIKSLEGSPLSLLALSALLVSVLFICFQPIVTQFILVNPPKNTKEIMGIFLLLYAFPFITVGYTYLQYFRLERWSILIILLVFVYEIYFLSMLSLDTVDNYIREVERHVFENQPPKEWVRLSNANILLENKINNQIFDKGTLSSLRKKRRKLIKQRMKQKRPNFFSHPILYLQYQQNKKRITKIVKRIKKH